MKLQRIINLIFILMLPFLIKAQSLEDAKKWFLEGEYEQAKPIFEEEYNTNSNNAEINFWLGVIELNDGNLQKAEELLHFASQKRVLNSYLYLGELYSKTYRFDEAEKEFEKFEKANRRNKDALSKLDEKRDYADMLERMVRRTEDIQIIDSVVVNKNDFLDAYKLSSSSGSLQPVNSFFKNQPNDKMPLFINERGDKIYYSRDDGDRGHKIYSMESLLDEFGNEKPLSDNINQKGNQAYPFVMTDGVTIYFASDGHSTLGGYDIFVTRYNFASDTYLNPNHLNMPFNSPFNDYMMVIDEEKGVGWFASDRFQDKNFVSVYTFIPASGVTLIDNDDPEYLRRRALITSISESQKQGEDYTGLIEIARSEVKTQDKVIKDFEFVINDERTYYTLDDFHHGAARTLFSRAMDLENKLKEINSELAQKREQYAGGSKNQSITDSILLLEKESEQTHNEIKVLKLQARNEEIRNSF